MSFANLGSSARIFRTSSLVISVALATLAVGCGDQQPATSGEPLRGDVIDLGRDAPFAELRIPHDSRPDGALPPQRIPIDGPWTRVDARAPVWRTELPIRLRSKASSRPPRGMQLFDAEGARVPHASERVSASLIWTLEGDDLLVRTQGEASAPGTVQLDFPQAARRESALNHRFSGIANESEFVRRTLRVGAVSRAGLLLPAPATASWNLVVPDGAALSFATGLVPPELRDAAPSDGVTIEVVLDDGETRDTLFSRRVTEASFEETSIDLSAWGGREVRLSIETSPGESPTFDYAFVAHPVVARPSPDPERVVMLFADTLRPDHLGVHGYERDTSPFLDRFAKEAVVFEQARSVAPWTLPATKSVLTGLHPEEYRPAATLAARLAREGWATAFFAGSVVVSSSYGMHVGWDHHELHHLADANAQVDRALAWLDERRGRDALVVVHFMDPHLPYEEPAAYRNLFAGDAPDELGETFTRIDVRRLNPEDPDVRSYVVDRYDNNVRYLDAQMARLVGALDEEDLVVVFADHGEEFWEHGGFEHGHTLYDELLRVPLMIRAKGELEPSRVASPVSLLDVAPTLHELVGLDVTAPLDGSSLVPLARGDADAQASFEDRAQVFGRQLYGPVQWGVLHGKRKYMTRGADEHLFDLTEDPDETRDLIENEGWGAGAPHRAKIAEVLGRDVRIGFRLEARSVGRPASHPLTVTLDVPGGIEDAFVAHEPTLPTGADVAVDDDGATARWARGFTRGHQVLVAPNEPVPAVGGPVRLITSLAGRTRAVPVSITPDAASGLLRRPLDDVVLAPGLGLRLGHAIFVLPLEGEAGGIGFDAEDEEALRALGYVGGDD